MKKIVLFFCVSVLVLVSAEALLRLAGHLYMGRYYLEQLKAIADPGKDTIILCLGESSTAGLGVDWKDSYPQQLRRMLAEHYRRADIKVIVPPHVGQNTSQVANRIEGYLELYKPALILLMAGANNEWSLAESHIAKFLGPADPSGAGVRILCFLDSLRVYKLLRYLYLKYLVRENSAYMSSNEFYIYGHPELARFPPRRWVHSFAVPHRDAFVDLWRDDVDRIIDAAQRRKINIVLMTYPIVPAYLPVDEFIGMAERKNIPLVRNDRAFTPLFDSGAAREYLLHDRWHPNRKGYAIVAGEAFRCITENDLLRLKSA